MDNETWIALLSAEAVLAEASVANPTRCLRVALQAGSVRSQGVNQARVIGPGAEPMTAEHWEQWSLRPAPIPADRWSEWTFNHHRQSLDPPSRRRVASGFVGVQIARTDIEALAQRLGAQHAETSARKPKQKTYPEQIAQLLCAEFPEGPPQMRNTEIIAHLRRKHSDQLGQLSDRTLNRAKASAWPQLKRSNRTK